MCIYKSSGRFESYRYYKRVIQYGSQGILFCGLNLLIYTFLLYSPQRKLAFMASFLYYLLRGECNELDKWDYNNFYI